MEPSQSTTREGAHISRDGRSARRTPAVAALFAAAVLLTGCAASASALGVHTARVTIDGKALGEQPTITCNQTGWVWFIETEEKSPGFTAQVQTGGEVTPLSVQLTGLDGFTGGFSTATFGNAKAEIRNDTVTISGSAEGTFDDGTSRTPGTAKFEIRTSC
ncbi:lipoprotein LpqH [Mycolicibacterium sediminis]|uniref:Lipoprotein LppE n=1 Tax=Mycolicibacterium sediminis TaxID=1286180 RepID=A0A7I7QRN7_9MYCO|nr:lipoprotein LpqH [Mycolicibacterium sediminis]BBY29011.1 hypothetical protein MSEDJ_31070 [Mycolicibacterium sediminis]